ncbi:histidine kinase [Lucifera butyrica]|uniref:histidine kinase n=1 Tax=Lucifera butyrica TaxID=1351585 RepID=A0A498RHR7_9FIRM|nr:sensor histidine kinase [Lucifera butyrica]VBB09653.1 histidine kinase [Lucifera butyrica]
MPKEKHSIRDLCLAHTNLAMQDISILENMVNQLDVIATLTGTDIFIDALSTNEVDAIVLAWAYSHNSPSLYHNSVVGQMAYVTREPAVYQVLSTGKIVRNIRGISQEGLPIAQTVVPITNDRGMTIGVLIMERDISAEIRQEEKVEFLSQTAELLSHTFMSLTMTGWDWEKWLGNGIFIMDHKGKIIYTNKHAVSIVQVIYGTDSVDGNLVEALSFASFQEMVEGLKEPVNYEFAHASYMFQAHPLVTGGELSGCVISVRDVTELRQKEWELHVQSAVIKEIHHRIKNTLQNVVSLLHLQMRRSNSKKIKQEFTACVNRILSISMVHEVFAQYSLESIDLKELAEYILDRILENYCLPKQKIQALVQGQTVLISINQAVSIGLVFNELVSNSLKHGIKSAPYGEISIFIEESGGIVHLLVVDSGCELYGSEEEKLGLHIVKLLICEQLGGHFRLEHHSGSTIATVSFPLSTGEGIR